MEPSPSAKELIKDNEKRNCGIFQKRNVHEYESHATIMVKEDAPSLCVLDSVQFIFLN